MPKRSLNPGKNEPTKNDVTKAEHLNRAVDAALGRADGKPAKVDASIAPLLRIAGELREMPRGNFKAQLKSALEGRKNMSTVAEPVAAVGASATPRLTFKNAAKAIEFYTQAFGAKEIARFETGGSIPHAEVRIGDSVILLTEEWPEGQRFSAETLGSSPVQLSMQVDDVDAFAARAVAAGLKVLLPIGDKFYGRREGSFIDPFGYTWNISTLKEAMSVEEMHRRLASEMGPPRHAVQPEAKAGMVDPVRKGFRTVTPYLVAQDAPGVIEFVKKTFGAEEIFRAVGSAGGLHCEMRIEDSMMMIGGGGEGLAWKGDAALGAFHVYVRDCDAAYRRAMQAGATSLQEPADQPWGERTANVADAAGNYWYIATFKGEGEDYKSEGAPTVQPYLHPLRAEPMIDFLKRAFGVEESGRYTDQEGVIHHTTLKIGTSQLEMGEAQGPYKPMKSMFYLYVPDADATYRRAIAAGATSLHEPVDQPYGDRSGAVKDVFGNTWYIGTHIKDVTP